MIKFEIKYDTDLFEKIFLTVEPFKCGSKIKLKKNSMKVKLNNRNHLGKWLKNLTQKIEQFFFVFFSVPLKQLNMQTKNSSFLFSQIKMEDNEIFKNSNK